MKANGQMTCLMDKVFFKKLMVIVIQETGKMEKGTAKAHILKQMGIFTQVNGSMIFRTEMVKKPGLTAAGIKENTKEAKNMVRDTSNGLMDLHMMVISTTITLKVKASMHGLTGEPTGELGLTT